MTPLTSDHSLNHDACGGTCSLHEAINAPKAVERREFIRAAGLVFASLGLFGASASKAGAMDTVPIGDAVRLPSSRGDRAQDKRYAVPTVDGVSIDKDNSVIIARAAGKVYAFSLSCPHQNTALRWDAGDSQFVCPKHKSHYRADGSFIDGRATRDMDRLPIHRDGTALVVDVDGLIQQDENQTAWTAAFVAA
ncbi:MAG: Rieske (2Fe-2S) protein [bacterium]